MNTIIFSEAFNAFESLCGRAPVAHIRVGGEEYFVDSNNNVRSFNSGYIDGIECTVKIVVNEASGDTKTFDNVEMFFGPKNTAHVSKAVFSTSRQESEISTFSNFDIREGTHKLSIPRNVNNSGYPDRMRDKYLISEFCIDSRKINNGKYFTLPYIKTRFRKSFI